MHPPPAPSATVRAEAGAGRRGRRRWPTGPGRWPAGARTTNTQVAGSLAAAMMVSTTTSARRGVTPAVRARARTEVVWSPAGQDGGRAAGVPRADSTTPTPRSGLATDATPETTTGTTPRRPARCPRRLAPRCSARAVTAPRSPPASHGPGRAVAQPQGATPSRAAMITVSRNLVSVGRSRFLAGAHTRRPRRMTSAPNRARPPLTSAVQGRRPARTRTRTRTPGAADAAG